ncbi:hypothetical protein JIN77_15495 [Verrucomicrobiaceae bacterium R5-34]|uniref:Uncharacterized protein n=1 Tax=Oceaniferula flava TaxID=2800421 RepID=A0AAE2SE71_9BACT|nr:hypothetical protein [Oceaniferula flavus]MBK1832141.1 hypothetical protein [Verrucomicrobiaceae bacterium R5-34]MBK1856253.1 hypothetical protein [Oceaniferula flavus]MBM1137560.1 hypothetical protein [Oceaniferula flavus]
MAIYTHKLSFPCPDCGGILTMRSPDASGPCPLCTSLITVKLTVESAPVAKLGGEEEDTRLTWDKRAFRRCSDINKNSASTRSAQAQ